MSTYKAFVIVADVKGGEKPAAWRLAVTPGVHYVTTTETSPVDSLEVAKLVARVMSGKDLDSMKGPIDLE